MKDQNRSDDWPEHKLLILEHKTLITKQVSDMYMEIKDLEEKVSALEKEVAKLVVRITILGTLAGAVVTFFVNKLFPIIH